MNFFKKYFYQQSAFTLVEMEVAIVIFSAIVIVFFSFVAYIYKSQYYSLGQLEAVNNVRRSLEIVSEEIRNARQAETGAYTIVTADDQSFVFYSDVDNDDETEKIRYFLDNKELKKGVTESPYTGAEAVTTLAYYVVNGANPLFEYHDDDYTGSQAPLATPANVMEVKLVRLIIQVDRYENMIPPALTLESNVQIRNLKEN